MIVGEADGTTDGLPLGTSEGFDEGTSEGFDEGLAEGSSTGTSKETRNCPTRLRVVLPAGSVSSTK